jgi:hypothetical protein
MNKILIGDDLFSSQMENYSSESLLLGEPLMLETIQDFFLDIPGVVQRMERDEIRFKTHRKTRLDFLGIKFIYGCTQHLVNSLSDKKVKTLAATATALGLQYAESFIYSVVVPVKTKDDEVAPPIPNPILLALQPHHEQIKQIVNSMVWNLSVDERVRVTTLRAVLHFIDCVLANDYAHASADALYCIMAVAKAYAYMGAEKSGFLYNQKQYEKACFKMAKVLAEEMRGKHARV